jgi:hypothetical protein
VPVTPTYNQQPANEKRMAQALGYNPTTQAERVQKVKEDAEKKIKDEIGKGAAGMPGLPGLDDNGRLE